MVTETFTTDTDWAVPGGVFSATVTLEAEGASGGGNGGLVVGDLPTVRPGETFNIRFLSGGEAGGGTQAAGGGDGCDIRQDGSTLAAAGGAGGRGSSSESNGGVGGGLQGGDANDFSNASGNYFGGEGGTQTAGGAAGGSDSGPSGQDGSFRFGGDGAVATGDGGGGGSGWYGGGGGGANQDVTEGSGGGGASNYVDGLDTVTANEQGTSPRAPGDGALVTIEYPDPTPGAENLQITNTTATSNTLSWDAPTLPPEVDSIDQYRIYRDTDPGTVRADYTEVGTTPTPGFEDTGLENGTEYHYRIGADLFVPEAEGTITITGFRGV